MEKRYHQEQITVSPPGFEPVPSACAEVEAVQMS